MKYEMPLQLKKWEERRKLGRTKFILIYGIVYWGIPVGIIMVLFNGWRFGFSVPRIVTACITWPIAGVVYGFFMWHMMEKKYQQFLATNRG